MMHTPVIIELSDLFFYFIQLYLPNIPNQWWFGQQIFFVFSNSAER